jgi:hypothetical protein
MSTTSTERRIDQIMTDPAASKRLKSWLTSAMMDDPIDAANDAEILSNLLITRAWEFCGQQSKIVTSEEPELLGALKLAATTIRQTLEQRGYRPGQCTDAWADVVRKEVAALSTIKSVIENAEQHK